MIQSYPWYIADWRESETRIRLSLAERALYREMLDYCYLEGSLPIDQTQLSRIAGCSVSEIRKYLPAVEPLFCREGDRLTHAKVTEVRLKLDAYHKQKSHAGAASGRTRRQRALERITNVRSTAVEPSPTPTPTPAPEPDWGINFFPPLAKPLQAKKVVEMPDFAIEDWFEERMRRHPNKREKMLAKSILCEKGNASDPEWRREFTRIHEQWIASPQWNGRHMAFVPNMAKWISDESYLYEPPEEKTETQRAMEAL